MMAVRATATERVSKDIVDQLHLRNARCYIASFNRANLTYRVVPKSSPYEQVLKLIRGRPNESSIVYCASRRTADSLAAKLNADGVKAKPYQAGLDSADRAKHQEQFLRDDARVITATIAFGMGINKPNVRFVVHHDLPKNIESYYQETGRAGRDGLPSDCVLLFSASDVVKQRRFIEEKSEREQRVAQEQLRDMVHYAEYRDCRFATLQLTEAGRAALRERKPITLTKPFDVETTRQSKKHRAGDLECDEALFAQLRVLRRQIADERDVPAYVIFSDVSLREMARVYPTTSAEFGRIPGVGQQKLRDFAEPCTSAIKGYLTSNPRQPRVC